MNAPTAENLLHGVSEVFGRPECNAQSERLEATARLFHGNEHRGCVTRDGKSPAVAGGQAAETTAQVIIDVVIVAYNSRITLRACVEPLVGAPWVNVTVVDNASPDDSAAVVADLPIRTIKAPRNGGFAYGCNLGTAAGSGEFVLFLNPDARIDTLALRLLVRTLQSDPALGSVGPRTIGDHGQLHRTQRRFPRLRSTYSQALGLHRVAPHASWAGEVVQEPAAYVRPATPIGSPGRAC